MLVESASGISVEYAVQLIRTILLELERIYSHTIYLNRMFSYTENQVLINHTIAIKDALLDCFEEITGHRMFGTGHVFGDVNFNISSGNIKLIDKIINYTSSIFNKIKKLTNQNASLESLFKNRVIISEKDILQNKITGPFSWFNSLNSDLREKEPYLAYVEPQIQTILGNKGAINNNCIHSRILRLTSDVDNSIKIIKFLVDKYTPIYHRKEKLEQPLLTRGEYTKMIESPRGLIDIHVTVNKMGIIETIKITSPSDINKAIINNTLKGTLIDYTKPAFESLYLSMMEIDK
ncbi:MAG: hypothetical protein NTY22_03560 [Proteobacteria bacterium]|nr:hypothetical protein [Pseudomonadota bacterium]